MSLDGRQEKRLPFEIVVSLTSIREPNPPEETITQNVSPHGARVMTRRRWSPGDEPLLSAPASRHCCRARVVYCRPSAHDAFCVGLELRPGSAKWWASEVASVGDQ